MTQSLSSSQVERAIATAAAFEHERGGLGPHAIIDDLVGLAAYRRFMGCPDTERLASYAEDSLPLDEALRVAAHEERCPVCRADIADMRGVVQQGVNQFYASLPMWATPFVGRAQLRESLNATLTAGSAPLLTLTGAPGMGKTRLMLESAQEQAYLFPDGVWYVPLSNAEDAARVTGDIAHTVRLPLQSRADPLAQLQEFFVDKRALLVLDDVGPRSAAARVLDALTDRNAELRCLTTGADALELPGEQAVPLPPLRTSPEMRRPEIAGGLESVQLFAAHVLAAQTGEVFGERETLAAAAICAHAGGNPLAIELAAARVRDMSVREIQQRLDQRPPTDLTGSPDTSLQDLMVWTYDLLSERERHILQQVSVFAGGFFETQAADVCEDDAAPQILTGLHARALLQRTLVAGQARYRLLPPIQRFARQRLGAGAGMAQRRHALFFLRFAEARAARLVYADQVEMMEQMSADLSNVQTGMDWAQAEAQWPVVGRYGLALRSLLDLRADWQEAADRLRQAIAAFERSGETDARRQAEIALAKCLLRMGAYPESEALLLPIAQTAPPQTGVGLREAAELALGNLEQFRGRYAEATAWITRAMPGFEALGDRWSLADCRLNLGWIAWKQGDLLRAERLVLESLETLRERNDRYRIGNALSYLGNIAMAQGRLEEARRYFEACLQARQEFGDVRGTAGAIGNMGEVWQAAGEYARARYCYVEAARRFEQIGDRRNLTKMHSLQGEMALAQGDVARAREAFETALHIFQAIHDPHSAAEAQGSLGRVAQREGQWALALEHYRQSLAQLHTIGDQSSTAIVLYRCGQALWHLDRPASAVLALHVALRISRESGAQERTEIEAALEAMEATRDAAEVRAWRQEAEGLTLEEAVTRTLNAS